MVSISCLGVSVSACVGLISEGRLPSDAPARNQSLDALPIYAAWAVSGAGRVEGLPDGQDAAALGWGLSRGSRVGASGAASSLPMGERWGRVGDLSRVAPQKKCKIINFSYNPLKINKLKMPSQKINPRPLKDRPEAPTSVGKFKNGLGVSQESVPLAKNREGGRLKSFERERYLSSLCRNFRVRIER